MKATTKQRLFYKRESERTSRERLCRDVAFYGVTIIAALMGFLLVDANINLTNAESDLASNSVQIMQHL